VESANIGDNQDFLRDTENFSSSVTLQNSCTHCFNINFDTVL